MGLINEARKLWSCPAMLGWTNGNWVAVQPFLTCEARLEVFLSVGLQGWVFYFIKCDFKNGCFCFVFQITYIETSAKDPPMNVDKAFHELVRVIRYFAVVELTAFYVTYDYEMV